MLKEIRASIESYGDYSSDNYGVNSLRFTDEKGNRYYYSYNTLIAFKIGGEFHIIQNYWGTTTGKHLNWINKDKSIREDKETFNANYHRLARLI